MRRAVSHLMMMVCTALATLCSSSRANARGEEEVATGASAKVLIAGDDAETALLFADVAEQLERLDVRADVGRSAAVRPEDVVSAEAGEANMIARVWLDFTAPSEAILYVADRSGSRILVRRFPRMGRIEMAREATMAALQTAVDALLHGGQIGVTREEARVDLGLLPPLPPPEEARTGLGPPPAPPASSDGTTGSPPTREMKTAHTPPPSEEAKLGLAVAYEVGGYANNAIAHGPAVAVSLDRRVGGRLVGVSLIAQYRFPIQATAEPVKLRIDSGALRLVAFAQLTGNGSLDIRALVGGGVDVLRAEPDLVHIVDATLIPIGRVDTVFRAGLLGRLPLMIVNRPSLELDMGVDIAPFVRPFDIARATQTALLTPWIVRPIVRLGIAVP